MIIYVACYYSFAFISKFYTSKCLITLQKIKAQGHCACFNLIKLLNPTSEAVIKIFHQEIEEINICK